MVKTTQCLKKYNESNNKISVSKGISILKRWKDGLTLINSFSYATKVGEYLNILYRTILKYTKSGDYLKMCG